MILTNHLGLPRSIENAVRRDPYHRGAAHISVTGLIGPARKRAIEIAHADEITEDVAERIWALMGQVVHGILERADDEALVEKRLFIERHGWRISGQFDRYLLEGRLLQDYKLTSVFSIKDGAKAEWTAQSNCYALLLREHGYPVTDLEVVAILRDWQKAKAKHDPERYPQQPAVVLKVETWPAKQIETYITDRLLAHGWAQHELPECTAEERWERPAVYAITKKGNSRATSVHPTLEAAEQALTALPAASYAITERPAEQRRCQDYCPALPFCEQGQQLLKKIEESRLAKLWTVAPPRAPAANEEIGKETSNATKS